MIIKCIKNQCGYKAGEETKCIPIFAALGNAKYGVFHKATNEFVYIKLSHWDVVEQEKRA